MHLHLSNPETILIKKEMDIDSNDSSVFENPKSLYV